MTRIAPVFAALALAIGFTAVPAGQTPSTSTPPCETTPTAPAPSPTPTPTAPAPPSNLRILTGPGGGGGFDLEDIDLPSGPSVWPGDDGVSAPVVQSGGPHAYYFALGSRPDCAAAYSLRNPAQLEQYRTYKGTRPASVTYDPANDTDPRRQDAAKMVIPGHAASLPSQLRFPIGAHHPQNLMVTYDLWYGKEFAYANTGIDRYKGMLQFASPAGAFWTSLHGDFKNANAQTQNFPQYGTDGPFVVAPYLHGSSGAAQFYDFGTTRGGVNATLPYDVPNTQRRNYGSEALGPRDTSVDPGGAEFGVKAETWTRYWVFFERDPAHDKPATQPMYAYKLTIWIADETRSPVRLVNDLVVYPAQNSPGGWVQVWYEFNSSASQLALDKIAAGRGPLVAYLRNLVSLRGPSKSNVLTLLQRPLP